MEYETVLVIDEDTGETRYELYSQTREPVDIDRTRRVRSSRIRVYTPRVRVARYDIVPTNKESPRQDTPTSTLDVQVPKTRGGTNEFIRAFWVNGKPKCRTGYRYDFNKKMCRLIK